MQCSFGMSMHSFLFCCALFSFHSYVSWQAEECVFFDGIRLQRVKFAMLVFLVLNKWPNFISEVQIAGYAVFDASSCAEYFAKEDLKFYRLDV